MKNKIFTLVLIFLMLGTLSNAQVGIGTKVPKATLDVAGKPTEPLAMDGIIAPRITGDQLFAKQYTAEQKGAILFVTEAPDKANQIGQVEKVKQPGYYFFDGEKWLGIAAGGTGGTVWNRAGTDESAEENKDDMYVMGNVGVGVKVPEEKLHVTGKVKIEDLTGAKPEDKMVVVGSDGILRQSNEKPFRGVWNKAGTVEPAKLNEDDMYVQGKVGLGTDSPEEALHVAKGNVKLGEIKDAEKDDKVLVVGADGILRKSKYNMYPSYPSAVLRGRITAGTGAYSSETIRVGGVELKVVYAADDHSRGQVFMKFADSSLPTQKVHVEGAEKGHSWITNIYDYSDEISYAGFRKIFAFSFHIGASAYGSDVLVMTDKGLMYKVEYHSWAMGETPIVEHEKIFLIRLIEVNSEMF